MQVAILAGGRATRMGELTATTPKYLLPVAGRPFADHQLEWLAGAGVESAVLCVGHLGEAIREFVGDGSRWGLDVAYVDEGSELRGTAGALRLAADQGALEPSFRRPVRRFVPSVRPRRRLAHLCRRRAVDADVRAPQRGALGQIERRRRRRARNPLSKGARGPGFGGLDHIDYGFSILDRDATMKMIQPHAQTDLAEVYERLAAAGDVTAYEVTERFYEIGSPAGLAELEALLQRESS